jgi:RimJ/RimL family protein N-acetyltransferase
MIFVLFSSLGVLFMFTNFINRISLRFFYYKRTRIFHICAEDTPLLKIGLDLNIVPVSEDNIEDTINIDSTSFSLIKQLFESGELGFYAYSGDSIVHHSWVILGPNVIVSGLKNKNPLFEIDSTSAYIHYCVTASDWRGKGIYPFVLTEICRTIDKQFNRKKIFIAVTGNNTPSIKGILKAGFKDYGGIIAFNLFGFMIRRISTAESKQIQISW